MKVAQDLESRPPKESKKALCRLIDIKVSSMNMAIQEFSVGSTQPAATRLYEYASWSIPAAEQIEQSTKCEKEWLPNISVKLDTPPAARPLP